jgi:predicted MFS family arabinose efflux permease
LAAFARLDSQQYRQLLDFCDQSRLTLALAYRADTSLPPGLTLAIQQRTQDNARRWDKLRAEYERIATALQATGTDFVVLKGFSHCPDLSPDPLFRPQYDLDLYVPQPQLTMARKTALSLGYHEVQAASAEAIDHLPPMVRRTGWEWAGNYFDPEMPTALELHFQFWNELHDGFAMEGVEQFWERRAPKEFAGVRFPSLDPADRLGYACLHMLRHVLHGNLGLSHAYEISHFLHHQQGEAFWARCLALHSPSVVRAEAICFALAERWFHCKPATAVQEWTGRLSPEIRQWIDTRGWAPVARQFTPVKDELLLHLLLLDDQQKAWATIRRRLLPAVPAISWSPHAKEGSLSIGQRLRNRLRAAKYTASRLRFHAEAFPGTAAIALRFLSLRFEKHYWTFFACACLYDAGLFVFFLLYNLFLLQLGRQEGTIGFTTSAMTAGSIAGTLGAMAAIPRVGIKRVLQIAFPLVALDTALRATATSPIAILGLAFLGGCLNATWAVCMSPMLAALTTARNRIAGFSMMFARGIAMGVVASVIGGYLPSWIGWMSGGRMALLDSYRYALLLSSLLVLAALLPLSRLPSRFAGEGPASLEFRRPGRELLPLLAALVLWHLGTGLVNPFMTVMFAKAGYSSANIGLIASMSQALQAVAVLASPLMFRRMGRSRAISATAILTACASLGFVFVAPQFAPVSYGLYMMFQFAAEPALYACLMESVDVRERSTASGLNFLVVFLSQAIAASSGGQLILLLGYPTLFALASLLCVSAAMMFLRLNPGANAKLAAASTIGLQSPTDIVES